MISTYEQTLARLAIFTPEQRSLAHCPKPPYPSIAGDCRRGGDCGAMAFSESLLGRWVQARFRLNRENERLIGAQFRWSNQVARLVEVEGGSL